MGSVLIVRSRPLRPTSAGQLLLKHTKQMRLLRADLERDLQELAPSAPGGTLNLVQTLTLFKDALGTKTRLAHDMTSVKHASDLRLYRVCTLYAWPAALYQALCTNVALYQGVVFVPR